MDAPPPPPASDSALLRRPKKDRNKKGLALGAAAAKPGTLAGSNAADLLTRSSSLSSSSFSAAPPVPSRPRPPPIQVTGSSRRRASGLGGDGDATPTTADGGSSSGASAYASGSGSSFGTSLAGLSQSRRGSRAHEGAGGVGSSSAAHLAATLELGVEFKLDLRNEDVQVLNELGCGNGGTVSRALHVPTKAVMAKKVVHIATSDVTRKQILRELQIMHDCASPFIVSFYGAYLQDPHIAMCMEFMDKGSLDNIYKKVGPIPEPILGKIALAVVSGLTYLYEVHKIMHRDVKPSNILLNSLGQIKICDFGVSGELINSVADTFVGTSTYMSPERISGDPYTVKSDVWSLGITLIELAIGRFPFSSDDDEGSDGADSAEEHAATLARLSLGEVAEEAEYEDGLADLGDDTLSPTKPERKRESIALAEKQRQAKRESLRASSTPSSAVPPRSRKTSTASTSSSSKRKSVAGVSLAGSGHQMSILELLQHIVNEPAPRLPPGKFGHEMEEFVDASLRKEPMGWNVKKKGPLPREVARPTPKELLEYPWMQQSAAADTDVEAFARSI
ncbi:hypothetical protein JCM8097_002906 [Rhodosporidiobolus ruineniae]